MFHELFHQCSTSRSIVRHHALFARSEAGSLVSLGDRLADGSKALGGVSVPMVELPAQLARLPLEDSETIQIAIFAYRPCEIAVFAMPFVDDQAAILRKVRLFLAVTVLAVRSGFRQVDAPLGHRLTSESRLGSFDGVYPAPDQPPAQEQITRKAPISRDCLKPWAASSGASEHVVSDIMCMAAVSMAILPAPTDRRSTSTEWHVKRAVVPTVIEVDPRSVDILNRAEDEHYRLTVCALCGGPELHAKTKPAAKCLRRGHYRLLERITAQLTRQRCRRCKEMFWAVLKMTACEKCRGKWRQPSETDIQPVRVVRR